MTTLNVQFTDSTKTSILSYFAGPQDPTFYENLGTVDSSDPKWETFYSAQPVQAQQTLPMPNSAS